MKKHPVICLINNVAVLGYIVDNRKVRQIQAATKKLWGEQKTLCQNVLENGVASLQPLTWNLADAFSGATLQVEGIDYVMNGNYLRNTSNNVDIDVLCIAPVVGGENLINDFLTPNNVLNFAYGDKNYPDGNADFGFYHPFLFSNWDCDNFNDFVKDHYNWSAKDDLVGEFCSSPLIGHFRQYPTLFTKMVETMKYPHWQLMMYALFSTIKTFGQPIYYYDEFYHSFMWSTDTPQPKNREELDYE